MNRGFWLRSGLIAFVVLTPILIFAAPSVAAFIYLTIVTLAPFWLPVVLALIAWPLWLTYARSKYVSQIPYTTLELKPGDNTPKTARPMELILYSLYYRTDVTWTSALLQGATRVPWSLEVCATGGTVRFYIHIPTHHRQAVEARLRSEYKDIDIDEARDYSREHHFNPFETKLKMVEFQLAKADPYPLMTYEAHEHAKEHRDVFAELLEELAKVPNGQQVWVALIIRPHQRDWGRGWYDWLNPPVDTLHEDASVEIQKLIGTAGDMRHVAAGVKDTVNAIEKALQKPSFDCGLRVAYTAPRNQWSVDRAESLEHLFDRFGDHTLNSLVPYDPRLDVGWPLSDIFAVAPALDDEYYLKLYRRRAFFAPPYYGRAFVLNTEELATLWHLPKFGRSSALARARGSRLEAPANLPV